MNFVMTAGRVSVSVGCLLAVLVLSTPVAQAQTLILYDDAVQNGFQNYSYPFADIPGRINFDHTTTVHSGAKAIAFIGNNYNAVALARPDAQPDLTTAAYPILRFWLHGGAAGGQNLAVNLEVGVTFIASKPIAAPAGGVWQEVIVDLTAPPFNAVTYDKISIQANAVAEQAVVYIDDVTVGPVAVAPVPTMVINNNITHVGMVSDQFTWRDSNNQPRSAVLAHNSGQVTPTGATGGALRSFSYQLPNGATRTAGLTGYGAGEAGFGYIVSHPSRSIGCVAGDSSALGGFQPQIGFERVFQGRHHAIFRFRQDYPRRCTSSGAVVERKIPTVIDWIFVTGRDNPLWSVTYNVDQTYQTIGGAIDGENRFFDDSRAPYGELAIDGQGSEFIDGTAWGDRYKFTNTVSPLTVHSTWNYTVLNTVPYVKEWLNAPLTVANRRDATMGIVQTQTLAQQDAGGGRDAAVGTDVSRLWTKTSADPVDGTACPNEGAGYKMPCADDWAYQANANSVQFTNPNGSNNARLTWKTQYGFLGQTSYPTNNGLVATAPGYPKKSYSTYIVLGTHTSGPVETQVTQVETMQSITLSATVGSVVTSGPAGVTRVDTVTYAPAGYNHVYGALAFSAAGNQFDGNVAVGAGTLTKPLVIISNFTSATYPEVRLSGAAATSDVDYFASLRGGGTNELWITLNRNLTGATNRIQIISGGGGLPAVPAGVVATATTATQVNVTWGAAAGALSYQIDRRGPGGPFTQINTSGTPAYNDTTALANTAYLYRVRAVNGSGVSADSAADLATTVIFADSPLAAGIVVKALHLSQQRTAVNAVRALAPLPATVFTDAAASGTTIKGVHVTEMRTALDAARSALALSTGGYTDGALAGVVIKAVHFQESRARVE